MTNTPVEAADAARSRWPVREAIALRLEHLAATTSTDLTVYRGEIPGVPPTKVLAGNRDQSGRVAPYAVVHGGAGEADITGTLEATGGHDAFLDGQITFAAGYESDLLDLLDEVVPALHLWVPEIVGLDCGPLRQPAGTRPRVMRDDSARPARFMCPWQWQLHVATA